MKQKLFISALSLLGLSSMAQVVPNVDWVQYYSERAQISNVPSAIDANSNVYITGYTYQTGANADLTTVKYDAAGNVVWVQHYDNGGFEDANAIKLDAASNIYVTGESDGTGTGRDIVTVKYDVNGNQLWVARFNGTGNGNDVGNAMVVDGSGNVFVTGKTTSTGGNINYVTIKYNSSGVQQWVSTFNGTGNASDIAVAIDYSSTGRLFITGNSQNISSNNDIVTIRLNPNNGNQMWTKTTNGSANANDASYALLADGNDVVVVGSLNNTTTNDDYYIQKHNGNNGNSIWQKSYDFTNSSNKATAIVMDASGNYAVTGTVLNASIVEYHTLLFNSSGTQQWVNKVSTGLNYSNANPQIAVDPIANHFYVCGQKNTNVSDILVYQLTPSGNKSWEETFNGAQNNQDVAVDLVVNSQGILYVAGASLNSNAKFDYTTVRISQTPVYFPIDLNNAAEPFNSSHLYYPNTGEILDENGSVTNTPLYYSKFSKPTTYILRDRVSFCEATSDTSKVNPVDTISRVDMVFVEANKNTKIYPFEFQNNTALNYFLPHTGAAGITNVKGGTRLMMPNIYPNIDLHYYSNASGFKYYFVVKPGGNPKQIQIRFDGAVNTSLSPNNDLTVQSGLGSFTFEKPTIYNVTFALTTPLSGGSTGWIYNGNGLYTIDAGSYNTSLPLVIEVDKGNLVASPSANANLEWSTYVGGSNLETQHQVKTDALNNSYICGSSKSTNFPVSPGTNPYIPIYEDGVFVKFNQLGVMDFSSYFGGTSQDIATTLAVATNGDIYIAGHTKSSDFYIKNKPGAYNQASQGGPIFNQLLGGYDGFIIQFPALTSDPIAWSTYYGSNYDDYFNKIKFDANGNLFAIGWTTSTSLPGASAGSHYYQLCNNNTNPVQTGPSYDTFTEDAFIIKLNAGTDNINWGSCVGGLVGNGTSYSNDNFADIDFNPATNDVYVTGYCFANSYPIVNVAGSFTGVPNTATGKQYIITQFSNSGTMKWSQLFGKYAQGRAIKFLPNGNYIVAGETYGTVVPFYTLNNGSFFYQGTYGGSTDATFAVFNSNNQLLHSSYLGGTGSEQIDDIALDSHQNVYFVGNTDNNNFFTKTYTGAYNQVFNGYRDLFIFGLSPNLGQNFWSTKLGGNYSEDNASVAIDNLDRMFISSQAYSSTLFPWDNDGGIPYFDNTLGGNSDLSITRLKLDLFNLVSVREIEGYTNSSFLIFPNPTNETINVKVDENILIKKMEVINQLGQVVIEKILTTSVNVSQLADGIYIVKLTTDKGSMTSKFIKN